MAIVRNRSINLEQTSQSSYDEGLRVFFVNLYKYMFLALMLTGGMALGVSSSPQLMQLIFGTPLAWVVMLAPLGIVFFMGFRISSMSVQAAQITYWAFAALMGVSLSTIFLAYTSVSIAKTFFVAASVFGSASLYGYVTKKDLTSFGSFLIMGLFGIIIASLVNLFFKSPAIEFVVSLLGVFIFIGLTAYDTQKLKRVYFQFAGSAEQAAKISIFGALTLYLDFINMFLFLLRFMGDRR